MGLIGALFLATILTVTQYHYIEHSVVYAWSATFICVSALRAALVVAYSRRGAAKSNPGYWRNLFALGAIAAAVVWGSASVLLFSTSSIESQVILAFSLAAVAAGSVPSLAASFPTACAFLAFSLLPLAGRFFIADSNLQFAMSASVAVFCLYLISVAHWIHRTLYSLAGLRNSNPELGAYLDTARYTAERTNEELRKEINERRGIEKELSEAKEDAEQANKSKGDFLAMISHEVRTPMNGVLGALDLVKDMPLGNEQKELVLTAHRSTESLIGMINSVLDFSKMEVGRLELEEIDFEVRSLVADVTGLLGKRAKEKGLQVYSRFSPRTPNVLCGDPTRLRQVLNNLVSNAVKFTNQGGVKVRVDVARQTPSHTHLLFEVEDTGIGISPEAQHGLFQPFTQAESSMARQFGGTGLGLSISKQLVELMGGHIGLRSTPGKGSTFWFTLRLARTRVQSARKDLQGLKLLVLSSNESVKSNLALSLKRLGGTFGFAANELEALDKIDYSARIGESWTYDVILIDSGCGAERIREFASKIRSNSVLTGTVIVVIGSRKDGFDGLDQFVDASLSNPTCEKVLLDCLATLTTAPMPVSLFGVDHVETVRHLEPPVLTGLSGPIESSEATGLERRQQRNDSSVRSRTTDAGTQQELQGHVLLVEDNVVNQRIARGVLERIGLSVGLASDGIEAVEAVVQGSYELVLMDCQMPRMDGLQATKEIRRLEATAEGTRVPIIAVTANAMEGDRERCISVGMDDYLAKPFKKEDLRGKLVKWMGRSVGSCRDQERPPAVAEATRDEPKTDERAGSSMAGDVLVVDDNAVNRKLASATLRRLGYRAKQVTDGREAVAAFQAERFDAILMDIEMPVMNGIEATQEIRKLEKNRNSSRTPILALTGHTDQSERERFLGSGIDDVLTKPVKKDVLASALRMRISQFRNRGEKMDSNDAEVKATVAPPVDGDTLSALREILEDEFDEVIEAFLKDVPEQLYAIRDGIRAGDSDSVRIASHTLKSSAANLGAQTLSAQSKKLEMLARDGVLAGAVELLKQMVEEFRRVRAALQSI